MLSRIFVLFGIVAIAAAASSSTAAASSTAASATPSGADDGLCRGFDVLAQCCSETRENELLTSRCVPAPARDPDHPMKDSRCNRLETPLCCYTAYRKDNHGFTLSCVPGEF